MMTNVVVGGAPSFSAASSVASWSPSSLSRRAEIIEESFPHCALPCVQQNCASYDDACICQAEVKETIDRCVLGACALAEAIFTRNLTESTCQTPVRNRTVKFNVMIITMTGFAIGFVVPRLIYKQFFSPRKRLDIEDWTLITALLIGLPTVALTIFGLTAHGMGKDLWGLERSNLIAFGRYFYVIQILYILLITFVKLTLTFFYLNIFFGRGIRALLWGTAVFHLAGAIAFSIGIVFQCLPISYQWEKFNYINNNAVQGHCININAAGWANSGISVASDIWLLAIPLSQIHKLQLHWKKKLGAALMFMTGASVTVISFLRLASVRNYATTSNPTWDQWDIVWWSTIEVEVGLICTCLPAMRLIFVRIAPRIFGSEVGTSSITLNQLASKGSRPTREDEDEEATLPKHFSAPAGTCFNPTPKLPDLIYDSHNGSATSMSIGGAESHDGWHDQVPLKAVRKPEKWRSSAP